MTKPSNYRKPKPLQYTDVRQMNSTEETFLQHRLSHLCIRERLVLKLLQQDINSLMQEHRRLQHVRVCEPIATVDNTMRDIMMNQNRRKAWHRHCTQSAPPGRVLISGKEVSQGNSNSLVRLQSSRSASTFLQVQELEPEDSGILSLVLLKNMACIDSICERELANQREWQKQERERLKQIQRERLRQKIHTFLKTLDNI